ncbi:MAG: hypothetical protein AB1510_03490 [Bacillota bacterium]
MAGRLEILKEMLETTRRIAAAAEVLCLPGEEKNEEAARSVAEITELIAVRQRIIDDLEKIAPKDTADERESVLLLTEIEELNERAGRLLIAHREELARSLRRMREGKQVLAYLKHTQTTGRFLDHHK